MFGNRLNTINATKSKQICELYVLCFYKVDDLTEQLQSRIELHNQAVLAADKFQSEIRDKDLSITELKAIIQQLEAEIQDKIQEAEADKQVYLRKKTQYSVKLLVYLLGQIGLANSSN